MSTGSHKSVPLVPYEGRLWIKATDLAVEVLQWQPASLRRKLNEIAWRDKCCVTDSATLALLSVRRGPDRGTHGGRARSANLLAVDSLNELLQLLVPAATIRVLTNPLATVRVRRIAVGDRGGCKRSWGRKASDPNRFQRVPVTCRPQQ